MSPASSYYLGKALGLCMLIWFVVEALSWLSDQLARFIEAYAPYLIAAAIAVPITIVYLMVRRRPVG